MRSEKLEKNVAPPRGDEVGTGEILRGKVKWFDNRKGFGFLEPENGGEDVFVHHSHIEGQGERYRKLYANDAVTFELGTNEKGPTALHVVRDADQGEQTE